MYAWSLVPARASPSRNVRRYISCWVPVLHSTPWNRNACAPGWTPVRPCGPWHTRMDPLTALGFAGNILTFIDFSTKIFSRSINLYRGTEAAYRGTKPPGSEGPDEVDTITLNGRQRMEDELRSFIFVTRTIASHPKSKKKASPTTSRLVHIDTEVLDDNIKYMIEHTQVLQYASRHPGQIGESLQGIAAACDKVASQMLQRLERMRQTAKGKVWHSLKLAVQDLWNDSEVEDMKRMLDTHQRNLTVLMIGSLR